MTTVSRTASSTPTFFTTDDGKLSILWPDGTTQVIATKGSSVPPRSVRAVVAAASPVTMEPTDVLLATITAGDIVVHLPAASAYPGREYTIVALGSGHNVVVTPAGSDTIQQPADTALGATATLTPGGLEGAVSVATFVSDGVSKWYVAGYSLDYPAAHSV